MMRAIFLHSYCFVVGILSLPLVVRGNLIASAAVVTGSTTSTATASAKASSSDASTSSSSVCSPRRTSSPPYSKPIIHSNTVHSCGTPTVALEPIPSTTGPTFGVRSTSSPPSSLSVRGGEVIEVKSLEETQEILSKAEEKLVVIDFTASWCGPCKLIAPIYKELSDLEEIKRWGVIFLKVDVDENEDTAKVYDVKAMPTFLFIRNGEVVDRLMGANAARLKEMIEEYATSST